jgi:predicted ATPase
MTLQRSNFYVITGCSGGGKSTLIDALRGRGFLCVDEVGRRIVRQQLRIGGDATPWQDQIKFRELLLGRYMDVFEEVAERTRPVFFDRGIPEAIGWSRLLNVRTLKHHRAAARIYRYAKKVFVTPPWPEIFRQDEERRHRFEDALAQYPLALEVYLRCGYELIEIPKLPVAERVDFVLVQIGARC